MRRSTRRSRRHRNPRHGDQTEKPFFSKTHHDPVAASTGGAFFQPKSKEGLTIGRPGDQYEQEADQMADAVVSRGNQPSVVQQQQQPLVQRMDSSSRIEEDRQYPEKQDINTKGEEEDIQKQESGGAEEKEPEMSMQEEEQPEETPELGMQEEEPEEAPDVEAREEEKPEETPGVGMQEEEEPETPDVGTMEEEEPAMKVQEQPEDEEVSTKEAAGLSAAPRRTASPKLSRRIKESAGKGRPLDAKTKRQMESSFGVDFSKVNIHTDKEANEMNQKLGAQAFAHEKDIYFNAGKYNPETASGQRLLAHELTHVVQQTGGKRKKFRSHPVGKSDHKGNKENAASPESVVQSRFSPLANERLQKNGDGSGEHGVEEPGFTDRIKKQLWYNVANGAEAMGLTNAARHMRHYLNNSGSALSVNVDSMLRDLPGLQARLQQEIELFKQKANTRIAGGEQSFTINGDRKGYYATRAESSDWYFAIGGFTYWCTADVTVYQEGDKTMVNMHLTMHIFDRYNWDQGKSVNIAGITVTDESLGRLHQVGLAQEYEVIGRSSPHVISWEHIGPGETAEEATSESMDYDRRQGERSDPRRERSSDWRQEGGRRDTSEETRTGR